MLGQQLDRQKLFADFRQAIHREKCLPQ